MSNETKEQILIAEPTGPDVLPVSVLVHRVKNHLDVNFRGVYVSGEISNFKRHASGHCYFVLKDDEAQLRAVLWNSTAQRIRFVPKDGMLVEIRGRVTMFAARGEVQIIVDAVRQSGEGAAQKALEELRRRLHKEGLFSKAHKKLLPQYPNAIGVVTSGSGAALQDILSILSRRYPIATVYVLPVRVQGLTAPAAVAEAVRAFNAVPPDAEHRVEVLIVGRGGGSAEDLWAFNEEVVVRSIFESSIPIVSAVGHETDVTLSDFVADCRAATPSAAAEMVVPDRYEIANMIGGAQRKMRGDVTQIIENYRQRLDYLTGSYYFRRTVDQLNNLRNVVEDMRRRVAARTRQTVADRRIVVGALTRQLRFADPEAPLERGYALVRRDGVVIPSAGELSKQDRISLTFSDGERAADIVD